MSANTIHIEKMQDVAFSVVIEIPSCIEPLKYRPAQRQCWVRIPGEENWRRLDCVATPKYSTQTLYTLLQRYGFTHPIETIQLQQSWGPDNAKAADTECTPHQWHHPDCPPASHNQNYATVGDVSVRPGHNIEPKPDPAMSATVRQMISPYAVPKQETASPKPVLPASGSIPLFMDGVKIGDVVDVKISQTGKYTGTAKVRHATIIDDPIFPSAKETATVIDPFACVQPNSCPICLALVREEEAIRRTEKPIPVPVSCGLLDCAHCKALRDIWFKATLNQDAEKQKEYMNAVPKQETGHAASDMFAKTVCTPPKCPCGDTPASTSGHCKRCLDALYGAYWRTGEMFFMPSVKQIHFFDSIMQEKVRHAKAKEAAVQAAKPGCGCNPLSSTSARDCGTPVQKEDAGQAGN